MYERILVPIDGSPTAERGLAEAIALAALTGGRLRLVYVADLLTLVLAGERNPPSVDLLRVVRDGGRALLHAGCACAAEAGVAADSVLLENTAGRVAELVASEAERWHADLIVIGSHGRRGVARALLGSDAEWIARLAPVPVLIVRAPDVETAAA
jgi:nucleotide-binding universal stress UspA family protein